MDPTRLSGTGVALITPFTQNLEIDFDALARLLTHVEDHVDYFVVNGTTAESPTLTQSEKQAILDFVIGHNRHKKPVVFGLGGYNTKGLVDIFNSMDMSGVDAILSVSPHYVRPSQDGIKAHFEYLANEFPLPVILYNVPSRTGSNMLPATTLALAAHPNIIGIKEASGNISQCMEIAQTMPEGFLLLSGDDLLTLPMTSFGAKGVISVVANAFPKEYCQGVVKNALAGRHREAWRYMSEILPINQLLFEEGNPAGVKTVLEILGICSPYVRMPLAQGSEKLKADMLANMPKIS